MTSDKQDRTAAIATHGSAAPEAGFPSPARPPEKWTSLDIAEWTRRRIGADRGKGHARQFSDFAKGAD